MTTVLYTFVALVAFAGNSVLCRIALGDGAIDPASFTAIRLLSGAVVLVVIVKLTQVIKPDINVKSNIKNNIKRHQNQFPQSLNPITQILTGLKTGKFKAATMLFVYALTFSYAYKSLDTGIGALILFGSVQMTMVICGLISGQKIQLSELVGLVTAFSGFVYLMMPGASSPSFVGFILMSISGVAWGLYTLKGRGVNNPIKDTCDNFFWTLPWVVLLLMVTIAFSTITYSGVILAIVSGGLASAVGYVIWYAALKGLSAIQAGVVQLLVPIIAALGGVFFASEQVTLELALASVIILSGIMLVVSSRYFHH